MLRDTRRFGRRGRRIELAGDDQHRHVESGRSLEVRVDALSLRPDPAGRLLPADAIVAEKGAGGRAADVVFVDERDVLGARGRDEQPVRQHTREAGGLFELAARERAEITTGGTGTGAAAEANVRKFVEGGGVVVAAGSAAESIAQTLQLPVTDYMVERMPGQPERPLSSDKFYVPGSIVRVAVDTAAPSATGSEAQIDVFFNNSPVFRLAPDAFSRGVRPVMWFDSETPLRSGWAWGQNYLEGGVAAFEATVGRGRAYAFGPEITFRAQPHGTFKFLFNAIHEPSRAGTSAGTGTASR